MDPLSQLLADAGKIDGFHETLLDLKEPFLDFCAHFSQNTGTVLLMSGGELDCARHHILGIKPWLTCSARNRRITLTVDDRTAELEEDPFAVVKALLDAFKQPPDPDSALPFRSGLMGYLAYDLKDRLENLPRTSLDLWNLPQLLLFAPSQIVLHDKIDQTTRLIVPQRERSQPTGLRPDPTDLEALLQTTRPSPAAHAVAGGVLRSNFTRPHYEEAVQKVKEYITAGHVYQVNISQRFETDFESDAFELFKALYHRNPAPFFAYIQAGDHQVLSTSPERFLTRQGSWVETRPIKGTRPRGKTVEEDTALGAELRESVKDGAELAMIVDLMRNDLGKVCEAGSVRVLEHKRLEAYQNVFHLISIVTGQLQPSRDSIDLLRATFPGGSITGCPKIRAMEIIDELEPCRRHIYTGAIGYIGFDDTLDLSIAIRTATLWNGKATFAVGGGIVYDSDPQAEYEETLHKGRTFMDIFAQTDQFADKTAWAWWNGQIMPLKQARIAINDQGLLYGYGFFETIRADRGKPRFLAEHAARFNRTWLQLFQSEPPDLTWEEIIRQVLQQNNLLDQTAAVKIMATFGSDPAPHFQPSLVVLARPYIHRLTQLSAPGIRLGTYPEPRQSPLAEHKTLNYLYCLLAGRWAREHQADEALILNPNGTLSETHTANILLLDQKTLIRPLSRHVLPGIMQQKVCDLLETWGYRLILREIWPDELFSGPQVLLTNSLMGAVPVMSCDNRPVPFDSSLTDRINAALFAPPLMEEKA